MLVLGTTASGQRGNMRKNGAVVKCVCLPDTGSMVENLGPGHEAGEEVAQVVAVPRERQDLGSLFFLGGGRPETAMDSKDPVQKSSLHPDELEKRKSWA